MGSVVSGGVGLVVSLMVWGEWWCGISGEPDGVG